MVLNAISTQILDRKRQAQLHPNADDSLGEQTDHAASDAAVLEVHLHRSDRPGVSRSASEFPLPFNLHLFVAASSFSSHLNPIAVQQFSSLTKCQFCLCPLTKFHVRYFFRSLLFTTHLFSRISNKYMLLRVFLPPVLKSTTLTTLTAKNHRTPSQFICLFGRMPHFGFTFLFP